MARHVKRSSGSASKSCAMTVPAAELRGKPRGPSGTSHAPHARWPLDVRRHGETWASVGGDACPCPSLYLLRIVQIKYLGVRSTWATGRGRWGANEPCISCTRPWPRTARGGRQSALGAHVGGCRTWMMGQFARSLAAEMPLSTAEIRINTCLRVGNPSIKIIKKKYYLHSLKIPLAGMNKHTPCRGRNDSPLRLSGALIVTPGACIKPAFAPAPAIRGWSTCPGLVARRFCSGAGRLSAPSGPLSHTCAGLRVRSTAWCHLQSLPPWLRRLLRGPLLMLWPHVPFVLWRPSSFVLRSTACSSTRVTCAYCAHLILDGSGCASVERSRSLSLFFFLRNLFLTMFSCHCKFSCFRTEYDFTFGMNLWCAAGPCFPRCTLSVLVQVVQPSICTDTHFSVRFTCNCMELSLSWAGIQECAFPETFAGYLYFPTSESLSLIFSSFLRKGMY